MKVSMFFALLFLPFLSSSQNCVIRDTITITEMLPAKISLQDELDYFKKVICERNKEFKVDLEKVKIFLISDNDSPGLAVVQMGDDLAIFTSPGFIKTPDCGTIYYAQIGFLLETCKKLGG